MRIIVLLGQMECAVERLGRLGKKVSRQKSGNTNAEQKTRNFPEMRSKASSECKTERVKDCEIESLKK